MSSTRRILQGARRRMQREIEIEIIRLKRERNAALKTHIDALRAVARRYRDAGVVPVFANRGR